MMMARAVLMRISLGQYRSKLYHQGSGSHSSLCSALCTIAFTIFLVTYTVTILAEVVNRENCNIQARSKVTVDYLQQKAFTVADVSDFVLIDIEVDVNNSEGKRCEDIRLDIEDFEYSRYP